MTTEIIGYITKPTHKPTERHAEPRKIKSIHITNAVKSKLLGALLIVLGAMTIPICNDATGFVMFMFFGIVAITGGDNDD